MIHAENRALSGGLVDFSDFSDGNIVLCGCEGRCVLSQISHKYRLSSRVDRLI